MLWRQVWNDFSCKQLYVASEVAGEEAQNGLGCQTEFICDDTMRCTE